MDITRLSKRYDRLWSKAERLIEAFLNEHLKAIQAKDGESRSAPVREVYVAVQCLKRIYEGRQAALTGGGNDHQCVGSNGVADDVAQEISRRIQALCQEDDSDGDDEDSV